MSWKDRASQEATDIRQEQVRGWFVSWATHDTYGDGDCDRDNGASSWIILWVTHDSGRVGFKKVTLNIVIVNKLKKKKIDSDRSKIVVLKSV